MRIEATRELIASVDDVWALLAEPAHLADWWPGYATVRADRRGLQAGARWQIARSTKAGLLRRPGAEGLALLERVDRGRGLAWRDVQQQFSAAIRIDPTNGHTAARVTVEAPWWRLRVEGLRRAPGEALSRLHALCQTAAGL